ncbi:hypothetical protein PISL3812_01625 [Talaromyces islandicus]|uniref:Uncharacterized protein n=1 Tax=Talaromyces islandicus TaxID=28573 RepID=A0A0U1LML6_TALIS|nr:hypothetical protein PISL3812_01625 [Talaromyces islandicus]
MAIWPFGRKGKRPRSQMKASDAVDRRSSLPSAALSPVPEQAPVVRKPSRKRSKRDKHKGTPSHAAVEPLPALRSADTPVGFAYSLDNHTSLSSIGQDNFSASRATPTLQKRSSTNGKGTLKKRLSKRSARELQREQEIRAMSSSPPPNHPHSAAALANLGPSASTRHADHHFSNQSLPMDSRSSLSDQSDSYTYKVNAFAVLAPRPILRCSDNSKYGPSRSLNPSATSMRKDIKLGDDEDFHSRQRIAELADDLDAPALRELMERDRRRREKKRQENQERIQRRLQRRAERDREHERNMATNPTIGLTENLEDLRGRDHTPSPATSSKQLSTESAVEQPGSWLRGSSKESQRKSNRFSDISSHVIGNIDDRSIRAGKTGEESTPQQHQSPPPQNFSSPRINNLAPESVSDLSRTEKSEKRLSDNSGRRMASWMSFFTRGSPRSKASRDLDAPPSDFSNTSRESFSKIPATGPVHTAAVPIPIPERSFLRTGTSHRSQSKFTEHLGDFPISPPDSRVQSPIPVPFERSTNISPVHESAADVSPQHQPEVEDVDRTWDDNSGMLSQSLASIDSEGSWMSGKFLRRISQNTNNTAWRSSAGKPRLQETNEMDDLASDEYLDELAEEPLDNSAAELRRASSSAMGLEIAADSDRSPSPDGQGKNATESWRGGVARKPTVVRNAAAAARVQSKEIVLTDIDMLDASMDESPISPVSQDEEPVGIQRAHSVDYGRGHGHARQMSAGSAKLLDIPPRSSVDLNKEYSTGQI